MKNKTLVLLTALLVVMLALLPFAVPSGAVTAEAKARYMASMPLDDEYAFLE